MAYQPNIPTGTVDLDQDYLNLRGNFQQLDTSFGIDHLPFSNNTAQLGFHKAVHLIPQADPPNSTAGQIYSKVATVPAGGDAQLFYKTVMGGIEQITGSAANVNNGFAWFSGIRAQWGVVAATSATTVPVTFTPAFTNVFNAQVTRARTTASDPGANYVYYIDDSTFTNTGFNIISRDTHTWIYYWFAIGN